MLKNRKWLYWGLPLFGAVIGTIVTMQMIWQGEKPRDCIDNQVDALIGAVGWFGVGIIVSMLRG